MPSVLMRKVNFCMCSGTRRKRPPLTRDGSHPRTAATRPSSASHWVRTARLIIDLASETERPTFETLVVRPMAASLAALSAKSLPGLGCNKFPQPRRPGRPSAIVPPPSRTTQTALLICWGMRPGRPGGGPQGAP
ncbi:uncharacterized protein LOC143288343 isoform X1 [Babylonia areolata]|uniref:uncharacterized protein LOC143288343 isoform X1 n=1 Tax=Babylonia areolata TaxID=304850 RepID=UPI003FD52651